MDVAMLSLVSARQKRDGWNDHFFSPRRGGDSEGEFFVSDRRPTFGLLLSQDVQQLLTAALAICVQHGRWSIHLHLRREFEQRLGKLTGKMREIHAGTGRYYIS